MKVGTALAAALTNSRTVVMPGAGYMMMVVDAGAGGGYCELFSPRTRKMPLPESGSMLWRLQEWLSPAHYVRASSRAKNELCRRILQRLDRSIPRHNGVDGIELEFPLR